MKTTTIGACVVPLLLLAACQEKPKITTVVMTSIGAFRSPPNAPPPILAFAVPDEAQNIIAVAQYNSDDCSTPPLGTITVTDAPGSPIVASNATGSIKVPGSGECARKVIPARCLRITWKGAAPLGTTHQGLRWRYSAGPAGDNTIDVQVHTVGGGKANCFSD